jgi:hypothetical protein
MRDVAHNMISFTNIRSVNADRLFTTVSKNRYLHMRIAVLGYADAIIHMPFIDNIYIIFNKLTRTTSFCCLILK